MQRYCTNRDSEIVSATVKGQGVWTRLTAMTTTILLSMHLRAALSVRCTSPSSAPSTTIVSSRDETIFGEAAYRRERSRHIRP